MSETTKSFPYISTKSGSNVDASVSSYTADFIMETARHINLVDDEEEEKDPLAINSSVEQDELNLLQQQQQQPSTSTKHNHSLRRHVPRIIVKALPAEKRTTESTTSAAETTTTRTSPSSRSRRVQQTKTATNSTSTSVTSAAEAPVTTATTQASTMREVLASIPGFTVKPRRRSSKKISTAAQIEQTKDGKIDLETPDSILASTNLRALLNKTTFSLLPPLYQCNLIQLLPSVDREAIEGGVPQSSATTIMSTETIRLGSSSLNNEFFARACLEWRERLSEGEFTPENQIKIKTEAEREKSKLDPWKLKHFEPIWGEKPTNRASGSSNSTKTTFSEISVANTTNKAASSSSSSERGEFKIEAKGDLTAKILKTTKLSTNPIAIKEENATIDKSAVTANSTQNSNEVKFVEQQQPETESSRLICDKTDNNETKAEIVKCPNVSSSHIDMIEVPVLANECTKEDLQKRGTKRPSPDNNNSSQEMSFFSEVCESEETQRKGKQMKVEISNVNVPISSAESTANNSEDNGILYTLKMQKLDDVQNAMKQEKLNFINDAVDGVSKNLLSPNSQTHLQSNSIAQAQALSPSEIGSSEAQYSSTQQQPSCSVANNSINNSTCDSIMPLLSLSSASPATLATLTASATAAQPHADILQVVDCDEDEEMIEQKFADAENYVLESGEVSTDSNAETPSLAAIPESGNKVGLNDNKLIYSDALENGKIGRLPLLSITSQQ